MVTIAFHNGSAVRRAHNVRSEVVVRKQAHIDPNGIHETWRDETERQAYERIFGEAVGKYNDKQTRADRKITDYYSKVKSDKQKHTCYEVIVGIYGDDCTPKTGKCILSEFYQRWAERNPTLEVIGCYYHADERGGPHLHIDYIPVAIGYKNGMERQASMVKALENIGYHKEGRQTAQIAWERSERDYLEALCIAHGLRVDHPGTQKHRDTDTYKAEKELERRQAITAGEIELHEKRALGGTRVTVDADGLQMLRDRARAYMIQQSEPSLRTRSALVAIRQKDILKKESALLECEKALEEEKNTFLQLQRQLEREQVNNYTAINALTRLLNDIADTLQKVIDAYPMPNSLRKVITQIIRKIEMALDSDKHPSHHHQGAERE